MDGIHLFRLSDSAHNHPSPTAIPRTITSASKAKESTALLHILRPLPTLDIILGRYTNNTSPPWRLLGPDLKLGGNSKAVMNSI